MLAQQLNDPKDRWKSQHLEKKITVFAWRQFWSCLNDKGINYIEANKFIKYGAI